MVGRTPEYLGKKITASEMKLVGVYLVAVPLAVLVLTALAVTTGGGRAGLTTNGGAHGFTEIFVAYVTSAANNGQSFAGLSTNSAFYNVTTALAMLVGRFGLSVPALALAGVLARQGRKPVTRADTPTFAVLLVATTLIVAALGYFPALALGPIVDHLQLLRNG